MPLLELARDVFGLTPFGVFALALLRHEVRAALRRVEVVERLPTVARELSEVHQHG